MTTIEVILVRNKPRRCVSFNYTTLILLLGADLEKDTIADLYINASETTEHLFDLFTFENQRERGREIDTDVIHVYKNMFVFVIFTH